MLCWDSSLTVETTPCQARKAYVSIHVFLQRGVVFQLSAFIEQLASQSASEGDSPGFQQDAAANFSAFHDTIQQLRALLGNLPADKGLANYDKTSELETILKDFVNANKDALTAVNVMIYNIPGLGPVLGPSE